MQISQINNLTSLFYFLTMSNFSQFVVSQYLRSTKQKLLFPEFSRVFLIFLILDTKWGIPLFIVVRLMSNALKTILSIFGFAKFILIFNPILIDR